MPVDSEPAHTPGGNDLCASRKNRLVVSFVLAASDRQTVLKQADGGLQQYVTVQASLGESMKTKQGPAQTRSGCYWACLLTLSISNAIAAPQYDHDRKELESILEDLLDWLPGEWSSQPQIHYENTVRMPLEGEHEPWHRSFARIVAPQVGPFVIYGQINLGGRDGPIYQRSQVLYNISIDEQRGVVLVRGQPILDAEQFVNLQDRPELWGKIKMPNEAAIRCDFVWHRVGEQIVGVLDGRTPDYRGGGPGTCTYQTAREALHR